eukprot:TRINITY_DN6687_c0_g1_i3.p2 TRINITY_DN6687_c0_g1~~TRINITY_DN6687_c0_g1_i3.p2  ORF type:complete len:122 (+),score=23.00 TRINITY_DN6687_c0_g1_i3:1202-1567(+)
MLPFLGQAKLMGSADAFITTHGAQQAWMLFMPRYAVYYEVSVGSEISNWWLQTGLNEVVDITVCNALGIPFYNQKDTDHLCHEKGYMQQDISAIVKKAMACLERSGMLSDNMQHASRNISL